MKVILLHSHFNADHLAKVKAEMRQLGAPSIHAVKDEAYGAWIALEGCHRLRAAQALGLIPNMIEVPWSAESVDDVVPQCDLDDNVTVEQLCDNISGRPTLSFSNEVENEEERD